MHDLRRAHCLLNSASPQGVGLGACRGLRNCTHERVGVLFYCGNLGLDSSRMEFFSGIGAELSAYLIKLKRFSSIRLTP